MLQHYWNLSIRLLSVISRMLEIELFDHFTVRIYKMCLKIIYLICMKKQDLALDNQQWLDDLASLVCNFSVLHSVVAGSISSEEDHGILCWWDLIRSKQLLSVSVCHAQVFAEFSGRGNSIHNNGWYAIKPTSNGCYKSFHKRSCISIRSRADLR